jgi:hypothetical protein
MEGNGVKMSVSPSALIGWLCLGVSSLRSAEKMVRPEGNSLKFEECWPGTEYVDILSLDCPRDFKQSYCDDLLKLAAGQPIALAEGGVPPSLEILAQQPNWTWWMAWAGMGGARGPGRAEAMRTLVNDPRSWSLSDVEYRRAVAPIRLASGLVAEPPATPAP